jgi:hypothetical protein
MATGSVQPFNPAVTVSIAATTATSSTASGIAQNPNGLNNGPTECVVYNSGTTLAFVAFGNGSAAALLTSYPVPPGATRLVSVGPNVNFAAAIMLTGAGTVYFSFGNGSVF